MRFDSFLRVILIACFIAGLGAPAYGAARGDIDDVRVGERGAQTRIALFCKGPCSISKRENGVFLLHGANADFDLDLSGHSRHVFELVAVSAGGGSLLRVTPNYSIEFANVKNCTIDERAAACIDLFFDLPEGQDELSALALETRLTPPAAQRETASPTASPSAPLQKDAAVEQAESPSTPNLASAPASQHGLRLSAPELKPSPTEPAVQSEATAPSMTLPSAPQLRLSDAPAVGPKPALREGAPERMTAYADHAASAPERLAPPRAPVLAKLQPIEEDMELRAPSMRAGRPAAREPEFARQVSLILGKELTPDFCENARAALQADAWALGAMADAGLCAGARGDLEKADGVLARLLEYSPDNYEALVGRALIALEVDEKSVARKYFQDALNASPPMAETTRIIAAMAAL